MKGQPYKHLKQWFGGIALAGLITTALLVLSWAGTTQASPIPVPPIGPMSGPAEQLHQTPVITIGAALVLSGPADFIGWPQLNAVQLAISQTNAAGGVEIGGVPHTLVLVAADSMCDETQAITAANTLLDAGAVAVVGHTCSGASNAAQPYYYTASVPMVSPSSSWPDLTEQGYTTTFRVFSRDDSSAVLLANHLYDELGLSSAAIVERVDFWSDTSADAFESTFSALGGTITSRRTVTSTADYAAVLAAIQLENPGAIYYADNNADDAGLLSCMAHKMGMDHITIAWDTVGADRNALGNYIREAGPAAAGDYAGLTSRDPRDMPGYSAFNATYQAAGFANYGDEAGIFGAFAYDDLQIILAAITRADSADPVAIRDALAVIGPYAGVVGDYEGFDTLGDVIPQWAWIEPLNPGWQPLGGPSSPGGQVNALAVHPTLSGTVYAAVASVGSYDTGPVVVYETIDGAASWTAVYTAKKPIYALAVTGTNVYAGAFNPGGEGASIYVSNDSGANWTVALSTTDRGVWTDIAVHPTDTNAAIIGGWAYRGPIQSGLVYRTDDAGLNWSPILTVTFPGIEGSVNAVLIHPFTPTLLLASAHADNSSDSILFRSEDGGATWPVTFTISGTHVISFKAHANDPHLLYAGTGGSNFTWGPNQVYRSTDAGLSWAEVYTEAGGQLAFEPPSTVYAVASWGEIFASTADGDPGTWNMVGGIWDGARSFDIDLGPATATLYIGGDQHGVFKSTNGGQDWEERNEGIETLVQPRDIDVDPQDRAKLFAAADCSGGWMTIDGGATWVRPVGLPDCVGTFAINPEEPNIVYGGAGGCEVVFRSEDGGMNFETVYTATSCAGGGYENILALAIAPSMSSTVYAAGHGDPTGEGYRTVILRSPNDGISWTTVFTMAAQSSIHSLAIDPTDDNIVYVGGEDCNTGGPFCWHFVFRTTDGGQSWTRVLSGTHGQVDSIVVDYQKPNVLYAGTNNDEIFKSTDWGDSWTLIRPCCPSGNRLAIDPHVPSHVYLAGWGYVAESVDGGQNWSDWDAPINIGVPGMNPTALTVDNGTVTQTLYGGFSGVWTYTRPAPQPSEPVTISMWTDPISGSVYANCINHAHYYGLVSDLHGNWVIDGTPVTVTYGSDWFPDDWVITKYTADGQIRGGELGFDTPGTLTFTAVANVRATNMVTMSVLYNPPAGISITGAPISLTVGGETGVISLSIPGLHDGCASSGTVVSLTSSLGSIVSRTFSVRGIATATLSSGDLAGTAVITATTDGYLDTTTVEFVSGDHTIYLPLVVKGSLMPSSTAP